MIVPLTSVGIYCMVGASIGMLLFMFKSKTSGGVIEWIWISLSVVLLIINIFKG